MAQGFQALLHNPRQQNALAILAVYAVKQHSDTCMPQAAVVNATIKNALAVD